MVCRQCGAFNAQEDSFCGNCGQPLPGTGPAAPNNQGTLLSSAPRTTGQPSDLGTPTIRAMNPPGNPGSGMRESDWNAPTQAVQAPLTPPLPPTIASDPWARQGPISPYPPPSAPTWNSGSTPPPVRQTTFPKKKRRRWPWYLLLTLVLLVGALAGTWLLFLRPIIHQDAETQIQRGLQAGVDQVPVSLAQDAPPGVPFLITEDQVNSYLNDQLSNLAPITDMHVSLQPGVMVVTLKTFGFGSTVRLGIALDGGRLVAQNVDVSGLLWWVEKGSELTPLLNNSLHQVQTRLGRPILSVNIEDGQIVVIFR
jgi:hypothetical protein